MSSDGLIHGQGPMKRLAALMNRPFGSRLRIRLRGIGARYFGWVRDDRAVVALEFAITANALIVMLLGSLEISFDFYTQSVLNIAVQAAAREIDTGNSQNLTSSSSFITNTICPAFNKALTCNTQNTFVKISAVDLTSGQDFYNITTGTLPLNGSTLDLSSYTICNPSPKQPVAISIIYLGPAILASFVPGFSAIYNGQRWHATMASSAAVTEFFSPQAVPAGVTPAATCQ